MVVNLNLNLLGSNPFLNAYFESDLFGKFIFISLFSLSICSWIIIFYKGWITHLAKKQSQNIYKAFENQRMNPLHLECDRFLQNKQINPFFDLYLVLKKHTLEILKKNRRFGMRQDGEESDVSHVSYMSPSDIDFVYSHLMSTVANQTKSLEKHLFILSTIVSLAPFLGLLGTVWGILLTFTDLSSATAGGANQMLGGISLALATTVLGLIDTIPALIGYNYLKNHIRDFQTDMECFSNELIASVEMYYRKVDVS